jgi:hypothetical protein
MEKDKNINVVLIIAALCLIIFLLGYSLGKNEKLGSNKNKTYEHGVVLEYDSLESKLEMYEECLQRSRSAVEDATSYLEYPEDYGGVYEAIEKALGSLEDTDFCGL